MDRVKAMFAAGGMTGLVLIMVLLMNLGAASESPAPGDLTDEQVNALIEQNQQLREAVQTMQARETQYQQQIEAANQMKSELQTQSVPSYYEDEEHEHEEHEDDD